MTPQSYQYQLPQQQARPTWCLLAYTVHMLQRKHATCMFTLQHVDCVGTHRLSLAYTQAISCTSCRRASAAESTRFGVVALSLSGTVLSRRVSLGLWSRTQITLALRDYMVLISVNAVLRLLKRSMCVRGRTYSVVCRYLPVW